MEKKIQYVQIPHNSCEDLFDTKRFGMANAEKVNAYHRSFPEYAPTPLAKLPALAKELGIADSIFFYGWQKNKEDIKKYYDQADIFVMPSLRETFGTVYIEALSQGLPVIYTRGQGIDGYFEQGTTGFACNPKDTDEIREAILRIAENYGSMSRTCVQASKSFQWHVIAKQYHEVIRQMRK